MNETLLRLLGVDPQRIPEGAEAEFMWAHAPQSLGLFLLVALAAFFVWGVYYFYRREISTCPPRVRMLLATVRVGVLLLLAMVLLGPTLAVSIRRTQQPTIVVLLDESQSMATRDRYAADAAAERVAAATGRTVESVRTERPTRATVINEAIDRDKAQWLEKLTSLGHVRVESFSTRVSPLRVIRARDADDVKSADKSAKNPDKNGADAAQDQPIAPLASPLLPADPTGGTTNIAKAVREALKQSTSGPLAAIVLITEGRHTGVDDDPLAAADLAGERRVPILAVGVGDDARPRSLRVTDLFADNAVWRGDPFELRATFEARGFDAKQFEIELLERKVPESGDSVGAAGDAGQVVETRTVAVEPIADDASAGGDSSGGRAQVSFKRQVQLAGNYVYTLRVKAPANEPIDQGGVSSGGPGVAQRAAPVNVLSEKARVLLISGAPTHTYRFIAPMLTREKTIDVSCWLQSMDIDMRQEGNTVIDRLPQSPTDLYQYDALVLLDPDPAAFNLAWIEAIKTFLGEHGGGMLYMAGPQFSVPFLRNAETRDFRDLLPVKFRDLASADVRQFLVKNNRQWPLKLVDANMDHPIMRFDDNPTSSASIWRRVPGVYWSFPAEAPKPTARVLAEHSNQSLRLHDAYQPLLVTGQYGPGRTVYMGFDSTWRWRKVGHDAQYFERFWLQTMRFLVEGRLLKGKHRGQIDLSGEQFHVGQTVRIKARLTDATYQPLDVASIEGVLRSPDGRQAPVELKPVPSQPGQYEGAVTASGLGLNELVITVPPTANRPGSPAATTGPVVINRQFTVEPPDAESRDVRLDRSLLAEIADHSGGQYFEINELDKVAAAIPARTETITERGRPIDLWDTDRLLVLLLVLLTIEWALRKRYKLV